MGIKLITGAQITVASAGSEQHIIAAAKSNVVAVYLSAPSTNTGHVYVGDADVAVGRGIEVPKGTTVKIEACHDGQLDMYEMYVDAATNGDKLNVAYLQKLSR